MPARSLGWGLLCLLLIVLPARLSGQEPAKTATAPTVDVAQPVAREVVDFNDFTGRTEAAQSVEIRPRVSGALEKVYFRGGMLVKKGDMLFEIDPRIFQVELEKAQAEVARAEAQFALAKANLDRAMKLLASAAISREEIDRAKADLDAAQTAIQLARTNLQLAQLNLSFTKVMAPIEGRISRSLLDPGNIVKADTSPLATIDSIDPVVVAFNVDERSYLRLRKAMKANADGKTELPVEIRLASSEEERPLSGVVSEIGTRIDSTTGTICFRAMLRNPDEQILPGMFARVRLGEGVPHEALLVDPHSAFAHDGKIFVDVVDDKNRVAQREVQLGILHDGLREVKSGISKSDWVIVDPSSTSSLQAGDVVKPNRTAAAKEAPEVPPRKP